MHPAGDLHMDSYTAFDRLIASGIVPDVVVTVFFNFILGEVLPCRRDVEGAASIAGDKSWVTPKNGHCMPTKALSLWIVELSGVDVPETNASSRSASSLARLRPVSSRAARATWGSPCGFENQTAPMSRNRFGRVCWRSFTARATTCWSGRRSSDRGTATPIPSTPSTRGGNSVRHSFCSLPLPAHPKTSCKSDIFNIYLTCALLAPRAF